MTDADEIVRLEREFLDAWSRGDARAAAALYAEDGSRVGAFGDTAQGRAAIQAAYERLMQGPMKGATAECPVSVRLLSSDVAVAQGPLTIRPLGDAPPIVGWSLDIWKKVGGRWQMLEAHPKIFPPRP